jgi:hypothetical protein
MALPLLHEVGSVLPKPLNSPSSPNKSVFAKTFHLEYATELQQAAYKHTQ